MLILTNSFTKKNTEHSQNESLKKAISKGKILRKINKHNVRVCFGHLILTSSNDCYLRCHRHDDNVQTYF